MKERKIGWRSQTNRREQRDVLGQEYALKAAATETLQRIDDDLRCVSTEVRPLLQEIRRRLFSEGFGAAKLRRIQQVGKNRMQLFRAELRQTATDYIATARMETAVRLLRDTRLPIAEISLLVGYEEPAALRLLIRRWFDLRPTELRDHLQRLTSDVGQPDEELLSLSLWQRLEQAKLTPAQAQRLQRRLEQVYGIDQSFCSSQTIERFSTKLCEQTIQALVGLPHQTGLQLLREQLSFSSPALFELLGERSVMEGRRDRQCGIELAELALASIEGSAKALGELHHDLLALGWARLGQARRLALDLDGAERAFVRAEQAWHTPRAETDQKILAEVLLLKGTLRMFQRRFDEAQELFHQTIGIGWTEEATVPLIKALIQRAKLADYLQQHTAAIADLHQALTLLEEQNQPYLQLIAYQNLATSHAFAGNTTPVRAFLPQAQQLCQQLDNHLVHHQLEWIEGLALLAEGKESAAEKLFRRARAGFHRLGERDHAAVVSLELALLCHHQSRTPEAISLAAEAIPVFKALHAYPEALTTLGLITQAVASGAITLGVLQRTRDCLLKLAHDPAAPPLSARA